MRKNISVRDQPSQPRDIVLCPVYENTEFPSHHWRLNEVAGTTKVPAHCACGATKEMRASGDEWGGIFDNDAWGRFRTVSFGGQG